MKDENLHTFVVLAYKESPYLEDCIRSLVRQTVKSNIILTTSTPSSFLTNIAARYSIPLFINNSREGIASDWNFAYSTCATKLLTLAHQDDIYFPIYSEELLRIGRIYTDCLIIFPWYNELQVNNKTRKESAILRAKKMILFLFAGKGKIRSRWKKRLLLSFGNPISCPGVVYNKSNIGNFKFSKQFTSNMDWEAWRLLSDKPGSFCYHNKLLFSHRIHAQSATTACIENNLRHEEDVLMLRRFWPSILIKIISFFYSFAFLSNQKEEN
ncbi:MAG: glycosyltransferase family 2 protein [Candidatus Scalindua sp.]|nr:glycosyltransferase family 2 protein [Candidatus Scalindua sp.]MCR4344000.1 glycosyltransferase family 2 protein [Candidatus Scalindua sp.]